MTPPRWTHALLQRFAQPDRVDEILGDLEEAHRRRLDRHRRPVATLLTGLEALDMAWALMRGDRTRPSRPYPLHVAARVGPEAAAFAGRLQELATEVDPALQLHEVITLDDSGWHQEIGYTAGLWVSLVGGGIEPTEALKADG